MSTSPMRSVPSNPAEFERLTGVITRHGWPLTKAAYVRAMEHPFVPTFPLDAETVARVPQELPGPMPSSPMDLLFSSKAPQVPPQTPSADGRRLDPSLVRSTAKRHGLSYEDAEQRLKEFGG
jgi:hypothetical protein